MLVNPNLTCSTQVPGGSWEICHLERARWWATVIVTSSFLDAFQKVADMATGTRGATKEIGSALTRMCMRHRSIESKLKLFTT
ncbi:unnamed protein product [Oncorhynchus mykiss]|uniref:IMD domain-containing protein n=1 Tax=Oncorhynchus mykiss TaxID=8022 RepID=A0A060W9Q4_ONCMY|nr:unnamed protein product [Oncorhynchus mykiss]